MDDRVVRESFEKWAKGKKLILTKSESPACKDQYTSVSTGGWWIIWQAAFASIKSMFEEAIKDFAGCANWQDTDTGRRVIDSFDTAHLVWLIEHKHKDLILSLNAEGK